MVRRISERSVFTQRIKVEVWRDDGRVSTSFQKSGQSQKASEWTRSFRLVPCS